MQTVPEVFGISGPLPVAVCFPDSAVALPADDPCLLDLTIKVIGTIVIVIIITHSSSCYPMIRAPGAYKGLQMRTVITFKYAHMHACTNTHTHTYTLCTNTHTREYIQTKPNTDMHSHPQFAHLHKAESGQSNHGNVVHHQYIPDLNGLV